VEDLELELRRLRDDVLDLLERRLVLARDLDDDVLVARRDRGLAQAELVDAIFHGLLRLSDGALADRVLDLVADLEADGLRVALLRRILNQLRLDGLAELVVD